MNTRILVSHRRQMGDDESVNGEMNDKKIVSLFN